MTRSRLGESDDVSDGFGAREDSDETVEAEGYTAMRRRAEFKGLNEVRESRDFVDV